ATRTIAALAVGSADNLSYNPPKCHVDKVTLASPSSIRNRAMFAAHSKPSFGPNIGAGRSPPLEAE
ncbi:MAG: hypothetical protein FWD57_14830, partial [Polyangiaceae bacterium]|nr:hypothetical protein [Polyangiaceae bacterium]